MWCKKFKIVFAECSAVERATFCKVGLCAFKCAHLVAERLVHARCFLCAVNSCLHGFQVGECKFNFNYAQMFKRVGRTGNVVVNKRAKHKHDCVHFANVGKKLVAKSFTFACAFNESTNVNNFNCCVHGALCLRHFGKCFKTWVEHFGHTNVWVLRGKWVRGCQGGTVRKCVI